MIKCNQHSCEFCKAGDCEAPSLTITNGICQTFYSVGESSKRMCECYVPAGEDKLCCCGTCKNWLWNSSKCSEEKTVLRLAGECF